MKKVFLPFVLVSIVLVLALPACGSRPATAPPARRRGGDITGNAAAKSAA
jgi:hypothetical protein